ncbi:MAG: ABC transporter ATP-binding protein [Bacillota bacterium]
MANVHVDKVSLLYHTPKDETQAIADVSLNVEQGEFVSIVGPSGCGKSSLLSIIAGLVKPSAGTVTICDSPVTGPSPQVGYMLQQDYLMDWRTVLDNACVGLEIRRQLTPERKQEVAGMLADYGLGDFLHHYPRHLSGGMRQRVALVRTLALKPDVLLLDEAFSALDYQTRIAMQDEVYQILRRRGKTILMVTHDIPEAVAMSDRVIILSPRPAVVTKEVQLAFDCQPRTPLCVRKDPNFGRYFNLIWEELRVSV